MKSRKWMPMIGLAIAVTLLAAPAVAQTIRLTADIPFAFTAGNVVLNPGRCMVKTVAYSTILLSDAEHHQVLVMLRTDDLREADDAKMIFHRYGDRYFLERIETPDASYRLPVSRAEAELARAHSPQQVAVLAGNFTPPR